MGSPQDRRIYRARARCCLCLGTMIERTPNPKRRHRLSTRHHHGTRSHSVLRGPQDRSICAASSTAADPIANPLRAPGPQNLCRPFRRRRPNLQSVKPHLGNVSWLTVADWSGNLTAAPHDCGHNCVVGRATATATTVAMYCGPGTSCSHDGHPSSASIGRERRHKSRCRLVVGSTGREIGKRDGIPSWETLDC